LEAGRSTATSTVESGAATMKMISSTSITSMNGVTLISWFSSRSSLSLREFRLPAMGVSKNAFGRGREKRDPGNETSDAGT
jgi:hypothetical protein